METADRRLCGMFYSEERDRLVDFCAPHMSVSKRFRPQDSP
jgi:hypothetical protein